MFSRLFIGWKQWKEKRRNRIRHVHKHQVTSEQWKAAVKHPEYMLGGAGAVGPMVLEPDEEIKKPSKE